MPLFGKLWVRLHGYSEERMKAMQARTPPPIFFGSMILCYLLAAAALAFIIVNLNLRDHQDGILLGFAVWIIVAAVEFTGQISSDRHYGIYTINVAFQFVYLHLMCILLTLWR